MIDVLLVTTAGGLLAEKGHEEAFQGTGNILCLDLKGVNTGVNMSKIPQGALLRSVHVAECKLYLSRFGELKKKKKVSNCHLPSLSQQLWEVRRGLLVRSIRLREFAD